MGYKILRLKIFLINKFATVIRINYQHGSESVIAHRRHVWRGNDIVEKNCPRHWTYMTASSLARPTPRYAKLINHIMIPKLIKPEKRRWGASCWSFARCQMPTAKVERRRSRFRPKKPLLQHSYKFMKRMPLKICAPCFQCREPLVQSRCCDYLFFSSNDYSSAAVKFMRCKNTADEYRCQMMRHKTGF